MDRPELPELTPLPGHIDWDERELPSESNRAPVPDYVWQHIAEMESAQVTPVLKQNVRDQTPLTVEKFQAELKPQAAGDAKLPLVEGAKLFNPIAEPQAAASDEMDDSPPVPCPHVSQVDSNPLFK